MLYPTPPCKDSQLSGFVRLRLRELPGSQSKQLPWGPHDRELFRAAVGCNRSLDRSEATLSRLLQLHEVAQSQRRVLSLKFRELPVWLSMD